MLKSIMISFGSIIGIFLMFFLVWLFVLNDDDNGSLTNPQQIEQTEVLTENKQEEAEDHAEEEPEVVENIEFSRSNLKIISID